MCIKQDGHLGHKVYRKPTQRDLYFNALSYHHLTQKRSVFATLIHQARVISDTDALQEEMAHLCQVFLANGYTSQEVHRAMTKAVLPKETYILE